MKIAECPLKIGDKVMIEGGFGPYEITDIATKHFARSGKTFFSYEFDNNLEYEQWEFIRRLDEVEVENDSI